MELMTFLIKKYKNKTFCQRVHAVFPDSSIFLIIENGRATTKGWETDPKLSFIHCFYLFKTFDLQSYPPDHKRSLRITAFRY